MAIIYGNPLGEIRGKLGGTIYSRNRFGAVARSYKKPIQPNSNAQIQQRARLGNMSALFKNLTELQRRQWEEWARTKYIPRHKINNGQYGAHSAFVGVNSLIQQMNSNIRPISATADGTPIVPGNIIQTSLPNPLYNIPLEQVSNQYEAALIPNTTISTINFDLISINDKFGFIFEARPTDQAKLVFQSSNARFLGSSYFNFFLMISDGTIRIDSRPKNIEMFLGGSTGNLELIPPYAGMDTLTITMGDNLNMLNYTNSPTTGQYVRCSLYAFNEYGTYVRLTRKTLQVQTAP